VIVGVVGTGSKMSYGVRMLMEAHDLKQLIHFGIEGPRILTYPVYEYVNRARYWIVMAV
jgi:hypothetical protein